jgi:hypothetical protein
MNDWSSIEGVIQLEFEALLWEANEELFVSIMLDSYFYGSLMNVWLDLDGQSYRTSTVDLSGKVAVKIPSDAVHRLSIVSGQRIKGTLRLRSFSPHSRIPEDVAAALEEASVNLGVLSAQERRHALLLIQEAALSHIREARIHALVKSCERLRYARLHKN